MTSITKARTAILALGLTTGLASCHDVLSVDANPYIINGQAIDPSDPATVDLLSRSGQQTFGRSLGWTATYSAWMSGEAWGTGTNEEVIGTTRRALVNTLSNLTNQMWQPLAQSRVQNDQVVLLLASATDKATNVNLARSALFAGFSMVLMGENWCQGTLANLVTGQPGPALTSAQVLDSAVARFSLANTTASAAAGALSGAAQAEALSYANAALVGRARAYLQEGKTAQAFTDAQAVPAGFVFNQPFFDDATNADRMRNKLQVETLGGVLDIPPAWRGLNDPRVPVNSPIAGLNAQDGTSPYVSQAKFSSYGAAIRLASRLEADYIAAEAQYPNLAPMLALINARRTANGQPAYSGGSAAPEVLAEFFDQRGRDFWLEAHRIADVRRATSVYHLAESVFRGLSPENTPYFRPGVAPFSSQTCFPIPITELQANPNPF